MTSVVSSKTSRRQSTRWSTPLRDDQFTWRPAPDAWSIGALPRPSERHRAARICRCSMKGSRSHPPRGLRRGPVQILVARSASGHSSANRQPRFRATAPQRVSSRRRADRATKSMAALRAYQVQYIDRLRQANGLDLARARVSSPVARWLRLSLGSGFALMAAHERRHLWQARRDHRCAGVSELSDQPRRRRRDTRAATM